MPAGEVVLTNSSDETQLRRMLEPYWRAGLAIAPFERNSRGVALMGLVERARQEEPWPGLASPQAANYLSLRIWLRRAERECA